MNDRVLRAAGASVLVAVAAAAGACRPAPPPLVTFFHSEAALSLQYPPTWTPHLAEQEAVRYRYFESPPGGPQRKTLTATVVSLHLAGSLGGSAELLLAGARIEQTRDATRGRLPGRRLRAVSADGALHHSLLLVQEGQRAYGLHTRGEAGAFAERLPEIEAMEASLTLERVADYPENRNQDWGFAVRVPPSWSSGRTFAGGGTYLTQYLSPPLAVDAEGQTVHAALTLTVEPAPDDGSVEAFRRATLKKLGGAYQLVGHQPWRDGVQDLLQMETSMAVSRSKRFYRTANGRAFGLAFEAREDVFPRVSRWCDLIASSLRVGGETGS